MKVTPQKKGKFLERLRAHGNVTLASRAIGIAPKTAYAWKKEDSVFSEDWKYALESYGHMLETEADRRAYEGCDRPVYQGKELVGYIKEYSDTLLIFRLKALFPDKYKEVSKREHGFDEETREVLGFAERVQLRKKQLEESRNGHSALSE